MLRVTTQCLSAKSSSIVHFFTFKKMAKANYVAYKTPKLKVLLDEGIKLNCNAKLYLEVIHVVKPPRFSPAAGIDGLA